MSRRLHALLITAALIVGTWLAVPADAQGRFWVLVNGALRYNGPIAVGNGTVAAPSKAFASQPGLGWFRAGANLLQLSGGGVAGVLFNSGTIISMPAGTTLGWSSAADPSGAGNDTTLTRVAAGQFGWTAVLFTNLGTPSNGAFCYCSDCTIAATCGSGGTGALAKRLNGVWVCN